MSVEAFHDALPCRVAEIEQTTPEVTILRLVANEGSLFDWRAGQYASIQFGDFEPRNFSIANAPGESFIEMHVRRTGAGGLSDFICDDMKTGEVLDVIGAYGSAFYRAKHGGPLLAVAGGTGLAPMKAIVEAALEGGLSRDVHLYFGVRDEKEIYLERYFIELTHRYPNFRFVTVISDPSEHSGRRSGLVGDAVAADFQLLYGFQCYLAGPPAMIVAAQQMLKLKSVPNHDIFTDQE